MQRVLGFINTPPHTQTKEGDEPNGHMVNIGLHYVAANNYGQPKDSDGDGIPDYVENCHGDGLYDLHADRNRLAESHDRWRHAGCLQRRL